VPATAFCQSPTPTPAPARRFLDARWLYSNAPRARLAGANQKTASALEAAAPPALLSAALTAAGDLRVAWASGEVDVLPRALLAAHDNSPAALAAATRAATPTFLGLHRAPAAPGAPPHPPPLFVPPPRATRAAPPLAAADLPAFAAPDVLADDATLYALLSAVNEHGVALVRGAGRGRGVVGELAGRAGYAPGGLPTIYGAAWDVALAPRPINIAYAQGALGVHVDLVYYESPPGLQLLHCAEFDDDVGGGESTFVDGFYAAEVLRRRDPAAFDVLTRVPATFEKVHYDRPAPVHMTYRRPHIAVAPPLEAQRTAPGGDGGTDAAPAAPPIVTGVFWAPMFEGALRVHPADVAPYYDAYAAFARVLADIEADGRMWLQFRATPGDVVVFNNRRMLHGRRAFAPQPARVVCGGGGGTTGGRRLLHGAYVNIDEFKSRLAWLATRFAPRGDGDGAAPPPLKRVGNQDVL
jgi:alpha-ketoglutarate-dependent taurine dioxygenase